MGYIYKIYNNFDNNIYIGQTKRTIQERWTQHKNCIYDTDTLLYNAMKKYGIDKFNIIEIEECKNELLDEREIYWISYYNSYNNGYNMTTGGNKGPDTSIPVNQYDLNGNYITTFKSRIDAANGDASKAHAIGRCCNGFLNSSCGHQWRNFTGDTNNITKVKNSKPKYRLVAQYDLNNNLLKKYNSITEAARTLVEEDKVRVTANQIQQVCKGNRKTAHGYIWKYVN